MLRIADQVELLAPVQPFRVYAHMVDVARVDMRLKIGEDEDYVYFDRLKGYAGACGIVTRILRQSAMVHWTHYIEPFKPIPGWHPFKALRLLHRPEYPIPENFHEREDALYQVR